VDDDKASVQPGWPAAPTAAGIFFWCVRRVASGRVAVRAACLADLLACDPTQIERARLSAQRDAAAVAGLVGIA